MAKFDQENSKVNADWMDSGSRTRIRNKGLVVFVSEIAEGAVVGEVSDALLRQDSHVDLQAQKCEDGQ